MTRDELITKCTHLLNAAGGCVQTNTPNEYSEHMRALRDLLLEQLAGPPHAARAGPAKPVNPEQVLNEIAIAIKHRTISTIHRWNIVHYHDRITCVPTYVTVPGQIILHEFTEKMWSDGFTVIYWNQLKQNIIAFYKELHG